MTYILNQIDSLGFSNSHSNYLDILIPILTGVAGFFCRELYEKYLKKGEKPILTIDYDCHWSSQYGIFPRKYVYEGKIVIENASNFYAYEVEIVFISKRIKYIINDSVSYGDNDSIKKLSLYPNNKWELKIRKEIDYYNKDQDDCPEPNSLFPDEMKKVHLKVKFRNNKGRKFYIQFKK